MTSHSQQPIPENEANHSALFMAERLRQARLSFNLTLSMAVATALIGMLGAILMFAGRLSHGAATTAGGLLSSGLWFTLNKDANDRLDKLIAELAEEEDSKRH